MFIFCIGIVFLYILLPTFISNAFHEVDAAETVWCITCQGESALFRIINQQSQRSLNASKDSSEQRFGGKVGATLPEEGLFPDNFWHIRKAGDAWRIINAHSQRILYAERDQNGDAGFGAVGSADAAAFDIWYIQPDVVVDGGYPGIG